MANGNIKEVEESDYFPNRRCRKVEKIARILVVDKKEMMSYLGISEAILLRYHVSDDELKFIFQTMQNGMDIVQAYNDVYYVGRGKARAEATVRRKAAVLLKKDGVRKVLRKCLDNQMGDMLLNLDNTILDRYIKRATFDPKTFMYTDGNLIPLEEIPKEWRVACIDGISTKYFKGADGDYCVKEYKLPDRQAALKTLAEYIDMNKNAGEKIANEPTVEKDREEEEGEDFSLLSDAELKRRAKDA